MKLLLAGILPWMMSCYVAEGKILLEKESLYKMLDQNNPYVAAIITKQKIQEGKLVYAQGEFDTKLGAKYDEKQYPASDGRLSDVYLEKPMENGLDLLLGYRKAQGMQEYNNIKTGDEGEMRVGVKAPLVPLIYGVNDRKILLKLTSLDSKSLKWEVVKHLRELHFNVIKDYYQLLFHNELTELEKTLLDKARQQYKFIEKKVSLEDEAPIVLVEAKQLVNERIQRWVERSNDFGIAKEQLVNYLNIAPQEFDKSFELPKLPEIPNYTFDAKTQIDKMIENRPDIQILDYEKKRLAQESALVQLMRYPQLDATVTGVHDGVYNDGFKVSLDMTFALERRKYEGKRLEIQSEKEKNFYEMKKKLLETHRDMTISIETLHSLQDNYTNAINEVALVKQLEQAELRKFELGQSNLFLLNQREIKTLQVRQKMLHYQLKILTTALEIEKETGELDKKIDSYGNLPL